MITKKNHPEIQAKSWIKVEGMDCLVTQIYRGYSLSGICEVVTNPEQPINRDVCWNGKEWVFSALPVLLNAADTPRLRDFSALLKKR